MYLYLVMSSTGMVKIGKSAKPYNRFLQLSTSSPVGLSLFFVYEYDEAVIDLEKTYHRMFKNKRMHGEWFCLGKPELIKIIEVNPSSVTSELKEFLDEAEKWGFFNMQALNRLYLAVPVSWRFDAIGQKYLESI